MKKGSAVSTPLPSSRGALTEERRNQRLTPGADALGKHVWGGTERELSTRDYFNLNIFKCLFKYKHFM